MQLEQVLEPWSTSGYSLLMLAEGGFVAGNVKERIGAMTR